MRPEDKEDDYIEDKENEEIEDINSDTQDNEATEEEANTHSDYKVPGKGDTRVTTYHLSGMYQNWFLDYASSVTCRTPYQRRFETCATPYPAFYETSG